jgi:hypothetical protein
VLFTMQDLDTLAGKHGRALQRPPTHVPPQGVAGDAFFLVMGDDEPNGLDGGLRRQVTLELEGGEVTGIGLPIVVVAGLHGVDLAIFRQPLAELGVITVCDGERDGLCAWCIGKGNRGSQLPSPHR